MPTLPGVLAMIVAPLIRGGRLGRRWPVLIAGSSGSAWLDYWTLPERPPARSRLTP